MKILVRLVVMILCGVFVAQRVEAQCSGVSVAPTTNLQTVIDANGTGVTFCLQTGTFNLSVGAVPKNGDIFWGTAGTVLDGGGTTNRAITGTGTEAGEHDVTVKFIKFQNFDEVAVQAGWRWTITDNEFTLNLIAVNLNTDAVFNRNQVHHNTQYGIVGGGDRVHIEDNDVYINNTGNYCGGTCLGDAGGSKIVGSTAGAVDLLWLNNRVWDNIGMGIWSDGNVRGRVERNLVYDNTEGGIFWEISWDVVILDNVVRNNAAESIGLSCWWGSNIHVNTSTNVEIFHNIVDASNGANGICAVSANRMNGLPYPDAVANLNVHHNTIAMTGVAYTGMVVDPAVAAGTVNNAFTHNRYRVSDVNGTFWVWPGATDPATWAQWQAAGQDLQGVRTLSILRRVYR